VALLLLLLLLLLPRLQGVPLDISSKEGPGRPECREDDKQVRAEAGA
jgi:hypothetical protein